MNEYLNAALTEAAKQDKSFVPNSGVALVSAVKPAQPEKENTQVELLVV